MLGVVINNLEELRKSGYHFVENEEGDFMRVEYEDKIVQSVGLTSEGRLEIRDSDGNEMKKCDSVKYMLGMGKEKLCVRFFNTPHP